MTAHCACPRGDILVSGLAFGEAGVGAPSGADGFVRFSNLPVSSSTAL